MTIFLLEWGAHGFNTSDIYVSLLQGSKIHWAVVSSTVVCSIELIRLLKAFDGDAHEGS